MTRIYHSIEAEECVLGGLMLDNNAWEKVVDKITAGDFYVSRHQIIFNAMIILAAKHSPFDWLTLAEELKKTNHFDEIGGDAYLVKLLDDTPTAVNIESYVNIVKEYSADRKLLAATSEIISLLENRKENRFDEAEKLIFQINDNKHIATHHASANLALILQNIQERKNNKNKLLGLSTGYYDLDRISKGLRNSNLIILAARPSMGKTQLALNIAEEIGINQKKTVLFFSMEMSDEEINERLLISLSKIESEKIQEGNLNGAEEIRVAEAASKISQSKIFLDESSGLTIMELRSRCRRIKREHDLALVVVDYLSLMKGEGENQNKKIGSISRGLKSIAKELKVPVLALQQLNRSVESRENKRPVMSDLRESGEIEQDADLILFIYRHVVYDENTPHKNVAEILIRKNRSGKIGTVFLNFFGDKCRFENYYGEKPVYEDNNQKKWDQGFKSNKRFNNFNDID